MVDYHAAIPMFVPQENVFPGYEGHTPRFIVLHKTASGGTAQDVAHFFATAPDKRSVHYVVGQDGTVVQCVSESDGAGGNCCLEPGHDAFWPTDINLNLITISIEHCDPTSDNSTPLTDAQKTSSFALIADICKRHGIPPRAADANGGIAGHHSIDPLSRARCPGNYPWNELWTALSQENPMGIDLNNPTVAQFFVEAGKGWQRKGTAYTLSGGILAWYKSVPFPDLCGLSLCGLPCSIEVVPLDKAGAAITGVVIQQFERGIVVYDPHRKFDSPPGAKGDCYFQHIEPYYPLPAQLAQAKKDFAALQQANNDTVKELETTRAALTDCQNKQPPPTT